MKLFCLTLSCLEMSRQQYLALMLSLVQVSGEPFSRILTQLRLVQGPVLLVYGPDTKRQSIYTSFKSLRTLEISST